MIFKSGSGPELRRLASLHRASLPDDILPMLGEAYLTSFYRSILASSKELLFIERGDRNQIIGACLITFESASLFRRTVMATFPSLCIAFIGRFLFFKGLRQAVGAVLRPDPVQGSGSFDPQIAFLFVEQAARRRLVGASLVAEACDHLKQKGIAALYVKTRSEGPSSALAFYRSRGFNEQGTLSFADRSYLMLRKSL